MIKLKTFCLSLLFPLAACGLETSSAAPRGPVSVPASPVQRCMNLGGALEAPNEGDWGYTVRVEDLQRIKDAGFDSVRLPVRWSAHAMTRAPYTIDPALIDRVKEIVAEADAIGLKIIVDLHHFDALMEAPDAQYERLFAMWRQIADAFEGAPDSLILELINEPRDKMSVARTDAVNQALLDIVRERHPDRWVIVGSAQWGTLPALLKSDPPEDDRIILTFHSYQPYDFTHQGAFFADPPPPTGREWGSDEEYRDLDQAVARAAQFAAEHGHPMFLGEFGVYEEVPLDQRVKWTRAMRETAEAHGFGWCYWDYATTFKAYNIDRETWIRSLLSALVED